VFEYSPQDMLRSLIEEVEVLIAGGSLNGGQGNSLIVKLENAIKNMDEDKPKTALNNLNALSNQIQDFIADGILTSEEGQSLLNAVDAIRYQITVRYAVN
jgi:hypothetical protein